MFTDNSESLFMYSKYCFTGVCVNHILQKRQLFADLNELSEEIEGVMMNHLNMFNIKSQSDVERIDERVK